MTLKPGDRVREGQHYGTVLHVGTVLVQFKTDEGRLRAVCPWELVKVPCSTHGQD